MTSFSETRAVIWVSGQLFETGMKLWPVSSEFVKIRIFIGKIEKVKNKCCNQKKVFCQKNIENEVVSKKSIWSDNCLPKFNFCHDFKSFETVKYVFLQVKKFLMDTCVFLIANSRPKFPPVNRQGLFTGGETGPNYWPWRIMYNFSVKPELLLGNIKIVLRLLTNFFYFSFLFQKISSQSFKLKVPVFAKIG